MSDRLKEAQQDDWKWSLKDNALLSAILSLVFSVAGAIIMGTTGNEIWIFPVVGIGLGFWSITYGLLQIIELLEKNDNKEEDA